MITFFTRDNLPRNELAQLTRTGASVMKNWLNVTNTIDVAVYSINGKCVAWCAVIKWDESPPYGLSNANGIGVYVHRDFRGKGIAKRLVRVMLKRLSKRYKKPNVMYCAEEYFNAIYARQAIKLGITPYFYTEFTPAHFEAR